MKQHGDVWIIGEVDPIPLPPKGRAAKPIPVAPRRPAPPADPPLTKRAASHARSAAPHRPGTPFEFERAGRGQSRPVEAFRSLRVPIASETPRDVLGASLSLFVPGAGQALRRETTDALFFLTGTVFCLVSAWAIVATHAGLSHTLTLLGAPLWAGIVAFAAMVVAAAGLHIVSVLRALGPGADSARSHPLLSAAASCAVPGWGQILNGCPVRAAFFLSVAWSTALGVAALCPAGLRLLASVGLDLPAWVNSPWGGALVIAAPLLAWIVGIYDAAATALSRTR